MGPLEMVSFKLPNLHGHQFYLSFGMVVRRTLPWLRSVDLLFCLGGDNGYSFTNKVASSPFYSLYQHNTSLPKVASDNCRLPLQKSLSVVLHILSRDLYSHIFRLLMGTSSTDTFPLGNDWKIGFLHSIVEGNLSFCRWLFARMRSNLLGQYSI